jgi:uncharacterized RDD family membrane protein YckC
MTDDLYRAPQAELIDPARAQPLALAPRGSRLGATILDQIVAMIPLTPALIAAVASLEQGTPQRFPPELIAWVGVSVLGLLAVLAVNLVLMARDGQTIGKRWLGIRVVRSDGSALTLGRYIGLRVLPVNLLAQVPILGIAVALADPLLIFRDSQKCLHDDFADTIVVMK